MFDFLWSTHEILLSPVCTAILPLPASHGVFSPAPVCQAQFLDQGGLTGAVQDPSGAAIPGAEVTLTNPETSFTQTTKAYGSGVYVFSPLKIGTYTVTVKAQGFEQTTQQSIPVNIGQRTSVNITLKPGGINESVTVTGAPPMVTNAG